MADEIRLGLIGASGVQASSDVELTAVCTTKFDSAEAKGTGRSGMPQAVVAAMGMQCRGSQVTRRWRKLDSNSQSHLNEKPFRGR